MEEVSYRGFPALQFETPALRALIIPQWGGKIASLYDRRREREWLWTNPHLEYRPPAYDANYVAEFDVGGFDECFPNVGAGPYPLKPWRDIPLPDHGEVWALPWEAKPRADGVDLRVHGVRLPYVLEKTVRFMADGRLRLDYTARNLTNFDMPVLWSSHPLLSVHEGMALQAPAVRMRVDNAANNFPAETGDDIPWPHYRHLDLSRLPPADAGWAVKLYTRRLQEGHVTLSDLNDGAAFHFRFDPRLVTHLGLWLNYGGWSGVPGATPYYNLALEPCIGAADHLDVSVQEGAYLTLPARGERTWWLEVALS